MPDDKYRISTQAIRDLEDIWDFTSNNWSIEQADNYYNEIISEFQFLADNKFTGKVFETSRTKYRSAKVKSHLIFYRLDTSGIIEVVRIQHQRMNIDDHL